MNKSSSSKAQGATLVTLVLDRSWSMTTILEETLGGINCYIENLRASDEDIRLSLILFDSIGPEMSLEKVFVAKPVAEVPQVTEADFKPRGGTPLIDAAIATIMAVDASLSAPEKRERTKVVIAIQTDGSENSSVRTWEELKGLVAQKETEGWEFVFMGAGIDAYDQGARMGISRDKTLSYGKNAAQTRSAFSASAANLSAFASGKCDTTAYSSVQKTEAGDAWG